MTATVRDLTDSATVPLCKHTHSDTVTETHHRDFEMCDCAFTVAVSSLCQRKQWLSDRQSPIVVTATQCVPVHCVIRLITEHVEVMRTLDEVFDHTFKSQTLGLS